MTSRDKRSRLIWLVWGMGLLLCASSYLWLPELLVEALEGESFHHLNRLVARHHLKDPDVRVASFYVALAQSFTTRVLALYALYGGLAIFLITNWRRRIIDFFNQPTSAINLGVFRIAVFAMALDFPLLAHKPFFVSPLSALDPPPIWREILAAGFWFPDFNVYLIYIFQGLCVLSLIGLKTRWATALATILGIYVLGVPQFFGKINHYHHIWLFMLYCSLSPSGDALSLDQKLSGQAVPPESGKYRWPLAWAAFTIGVLYFFPGIWKIMVSGTEWVFSDNLQNKMYTKWFESGFEPAVRIDRYPFVMQMGALFTIAFESLFVFSLFHPLTRWIAVLSAFSFHHFTWAFMGIYFYTLIAMYVVFVNWPPIISALTKLRISELWTGRSMNLQPMTKEWRRWWHWLPAGACTLLFMCGATLVDTWPVGVYPTFASLEKPYFKTLYIEQFRRSDGESVSSFLPLKDAKALGAFGGSGNVQSFVLNLSAEVNTEAKKNMAEAILKSLQADLTGAFMYKFYLAMFPTHPDAKEKRPQIEKAQLLLEL